MVPATNGHVNGLARRMDQLLTWNDGDDDEDEDPDPDPAILKAEPPHDAKQQKYTKKAGPSRDNSDSKNRADDGHLTEFVRQQGLQKIAYGDLDDYDDVDDDDLDPDLDPREGDFLAHPFWREHGPSSGRSENPYSSPIAVPRWVMAILAEANEILILSQLVYWFRIVAKKKGGLSCDGESWVVKTYEELGKEMCRNTRQVEDAVKALKKKEFIITARHRSKFHDGKTVTHYRLNLDGIQAAFRKASKKLLPGQ